MNLSDISLENTSTPSWILKIEGKLLDVITIISISLLLDN